jgi:hypothetical protein
VKYPQIQWLKYEEMWLMTIFNEASGSEWRRSETSKIAASASISVNGAESYLAA